MEQWREYQDSIDLDKELLEEGLKDKITKGLAGLALAGGLGFSSPSKAQNTSQPAGIEVSANKVNDMSSNIEKKLISIFNSSDIKDDIGLKITLKDDEIKGLAKTIAEYAVMRGHDSQKGVRVYSQTAVNILEDAFKRGAGRLEAIDLVKQSFEKRIAQTKAEKKKAKTVTRTQSFETRDNPRLVQQAVFAIFLAAGQGESLDKPMDDLMSKIKTAIDDGSMSKEDAKKILKLIPEGPSKMDEISKILGLQK